ncbi:flagellar biosynthetic protein FliR [Rhodovulum adriaticum]|uniref:Flagellar biosynthetic protein FliR n=1 Tax=Rhodovulum adriaticum TaxID=35804 RepID=A0A4R2NZL9_RHOAD|nr:flagellar biosynthetic protein FliR [Rhodovulum adriaticum]MBK1634773.1 flagellar biosynthesis protein FliR [Rhodovulum adriaticum]TCP27652.1 flagellar biosynthetic protein FliR [Rhodovulum adriaticum]
MNVTAADLLTPWQGPLLAWLFVFLRVGAVLALLPAFGERVVPMRIRLALALAFSAVVGPAVAPMLQGVGRVGPAALGYEVITGLALGLVLRLSILALQIAGDIAAQATSLSQILGGAAMDPQPAIGRLMVMAGLALATMAGLHLRAAEAMILSYRVLPPGQPPAAGPLADWGVGEIAGAFALAATLAMPFVAAALLYNLALGVINRAMPQLMVAFVGAPAITAGGLGLLMLALPPILAVWQWDLLARLADPFGSGG